MGAAALRRRRLGFDFHREPERRVNPTRSAPAPAPLTPHQALFWLWLITLPWKR